MKWLMLVHQLPPRPAYLRAKIAQRLAKVGALPLKNSVYVLPARPQSREDFEWIAQEAAAGGGRAWIAGVDWLVGETPRKSAPGAKPPRKADLRGKTWVTRRGVYVDRIASAWLVRRFVDPKARFRFVPDASSPVRRNELRLDMPQAEFTHEGDRCTFETLVHRLGLRDPALAAVAEIVHDIDLHDEKFHRPEAAGIRALLDGLVARQPNDTRRLQEGGAMFEDLYRALSVSLQEKRKPARKRRT
jgi:hypothetical protein